MSPSDAEQKIDAYLDRLRRRLRGVRSDELRDTVKELRSHIIDTVTTRGEMTAATVDEALDALGSPEELAAQYISAGLRSPARGTGSPIRVLESFFRWVFLSTAGSFVLLGTVVGYSLGLAFVLCAALKPFHPGTAGLWLLPDPAGDIVISLQLGFGQAPAGGAELLGWWIVPIGLMAGCGLVVITTRFTRWCCCLYRRTVLA
jgi:hypothetical protein